jgi:predicted Zn-dependent protease with MMP-like domain
MTRDEFEDCVEEALTDLPDEVAHLMDNIVVLVADEPSAEELDRVGVGDGCLLLGLYMGVPLGRRGRHRYGNVPPDRVVIYQRSIEAAYPRKCIVEGIRRTVLHEVGHHFGLSDAQLRQMGY